jgi:adenine nucleotide transporter 17
MDELQATAFEHSVTGGLGGMLALSLFYPLDNLRTRAQVDSDCLPTHERAQNKSTIETSLDQLVLIIKETNSHAEVAKILRRLPGLRAALEHQRDGLIKLQQFPDSFPEYQSPSGSPTSSPTLRGIKGSKSERSTWTIIRDTIDKEGVTGFYKGLSSGLVGMGAAWGTYYYVYNMLQQQALRFSNTAHVGQLSIITNLLVGAGAGSVACVVTNPLWVVNTRVKLKAEASEGLLAELFYLFRDEGFSGAMQGVMPALVLVSNPSIQFMSAEWMKTLLLTNFTTQYTRASLPAFIHFWVGASSKAIATLFTYPYQVVKTKMQQQGNSDASIQECIARIMTEEGLQGFFKGMQIKMGQTVLTSAAMFAIYDILLKLLVSFRRPGAVKW